MTDDPIDGPMSIVFDRSEDRFPAQTAVLVEPLADRRTGPREAAER